MDFDTFCRLVDDYGDPVYRFCRKLSPGGADDLYQETFLRILERRESIDGSGNIRSYIFKVCVNLWRSSLRKDSRLWNTYAQLEDAANLPDGEQSPEDRAIGAEAVRRLDRMIGELHERFRLPLYLFYTSEMKVDEIAKVLGIPPGTVKSRLHKARLLLKNQMEESDYERIAL